jgi:ABC-type lipoprotein export system ATPase subunit
MNIVEVKNLYKKYHKNGEELEVFKNLNLSVRQGSM